MEYSYFPGCAAHGTAIDQHLSTMAVLNALEIGLEELPDWNCCGATPGHTVGGDLALALSSRNLEIAAGQKRPLMVPCASCYSNLRKAAAYRREAGTFDPEGNAVEVISIAALLSEDEVLCRIHNKVKKPLRDLTVAPYYGCLLARPPEPAGAEDAENPLQIDRVAEACGAHAVQWSHKTECCGGPHTLSHPELVEKMSMPLLESARRRHADVIVTACPMCHTSLDSVQWKLRQRTADSPVVPVLYLTELVALALALPRPGRWLKKHLVNPIPFLKEKGALQ